MDQVMNWPLIYALANFIQEPRPEAYQQSMQADTVKNALHVQRPA